MMRRLFYTAFMFLFIGGCGLQSLSEHSGSYTFSPSPDTVDSNLYPLKHLIIIEENELTDQTLFYLFSGELAGANLGLRDLNHIAERFGPPANIQFKLPLEIFTSQPIEIEGTTVELNHSDETKLADLIELNNDGLFQSGASRWLRSTTQGVATYFGFFQSPLWTDSLSLSATAPGDSDYDNLEIQRLVSAATELTVTPDGEDHPADLLVTWQTASPSDYVTVDLLQTVTDIESELPVEVTVITSMEAEPPYRATWALIDEAFGKCCWSTARTLSARLTQISRAYVPREAGDWALIHRTIQAVNIPSENWTDQISSLELEDYCSAYR